MNALSGMEKFSHLEDKIYLTIEFVKKLRDERDKLLKENSELRSQTASFSGEPPATDDKVSELLAERDAIQLKVEAMLDALTQIA